jgi:hypothetical protein
MANVLAFSRAGEAIRCAQAQFERRLAAISVTGKSLLIFRNRVKSRNQKYSAFVLTQITGITPPVSPRMRGASRSSRTRSEMRWTWMAR